MMHAAIESTFEVSSGWQADSKPPLRHSARPARAANNAANVLDEPGLIHHTALVRPATGDSPAWEHHIQTIDLGGGRHKIRTLSGQRGARLRKTDHPGGPMSHDVAQARHQRMVDDCLSRDMHALTTGELVQMQAELASVNLNGMLPCLIVGGQAVTLDHCLEFRRDLSDEHSAMLAAAKSKGLLSSLARIGRIDGAQVQQAIARVVDQAHERISLKSFDFHMASTATQLTDLMG